MQFNPESRSSRETLAIQLLAKLTACGFSPESREGTDEALFSRAVDNTDGTVRVIVYTTVVPAGGKLIVRENGSDSIRVCALYTSPRTGRDHGIVSETRTHRTGQVEDIVTRVYERMRSVYRAANSANRCPKCGAPTFTSKNKNVVCADFCWKTDTELNADRAGYRPNPYARRTYGGRR